MRLSPSLLPPAYDARVMVDLEHARGHEDHGLISARVARKGKGGHAPNNARPRSDRAQLQDKKCCD
eukprot:8005005-Pyramimonas_sp.AAC.1